jgi:hypothetical protein
LLRPSWSAGMRSRVESQAACWKDHFLQFP